SSSTSSSARPRAHITRCLTSRSSRRTRWTAFGGATRRWPGRPGKGGRRPATRPNPKPSPPRSTPRSAGRHLDLDRDLDLEDRARRSAIVLVYTAEELVLPGLGVLRDLYVDLRLRGHDERLAVQIIEVDLKVPRVFDVQRRRLVVRIDEVD